MAENDGSIQERLIARAQSDPDFKQRLIDDPRAAIAEEAGTELPASVTVHVVEETANDVYLVIPASPSASGSLSDEELAAVAGGGTSLASCTSCGGEGSTCGAGSVWGSCD